MGRITRTIAIGMGISVALTAVGFLLVLSGAQATRALPAITPTLPSTFTPTPTETPVFSATLNIAAEPETLRTGQTLTLTVDLDVSEGCQYPIFELMLNQSAGEPPIFAPIQPPTGIITGPISLPSVWTFRATQPGTATFAARSSGEQFCGMAWLWHYESATSGPVSVVPWPHVIYVPFVVNNQDTHK